MTQTDQQGSAYLKLLPAIYSQPQVLSEHPFLGNYLKIFEKIMTGLNMDGPLLLQRRKGWGQMLAPMVIGELFYPRLSFLFPNNPCFIPDLNQQSLQTINDYFGVSNSPKPEAEVSEWLKSLLDFMASWVDLYLDHDFLDELHTPDIPIAYLNKMRNIIARIMPLYRKRGTREGLQGMIDLLIDLNYKGEPIIQVEIVSLAQTTPWQLGCNSTLHDAYRVGFPLVGGVRPWVFLVEITILCLTQNSGDEKKICGAACWTRIDEIVEKILLLIDREKPEYSHYVLKFRPTLEVGAARLGESSLLGSSLPLIHENPHGEKELK